MAIQSTTAAKATPPASGKGAQALKTNAKTAKKCAPNNKTGKCGFCERDGYPILPVRYAVLPSYVTAAGLKPLSNKPEARPLGEMLSAKSLGKPPKSDKSAKQEPNTALKLDTFDKQPLKANKYTLRTLRKGFVHVYLGTHGVWQSYVVTEDGYLRVLADPDDPDWKTERPLTEACKRAGDNIPASFITIPNGYETVWIAFSENVWNSTVRGRYEKAPATRMQQFDVKQVASNPDEAKHCFEIGPNNKRLHDMVFEYVGQESEYFSRRSYSGGGWDQKGNQATTKNIAWQSLHGNFARAGHSAALTGYAMNVADKRKAMQEPGKIAAFALYDAVGIVKELNGHTHDRIEWRQAYNATVARPLLISQAIVGLKKQIEASTQAAITEDETKRKVPDKVTKPTYEYDGIGGPVSIETTTRAERIDSQQKATWEKLKGSYNEAERSDFERRYSAKMKDFQTEIWKCDLDWVTWARADKWKAWLGDYDTKKLLDNVRLMTTFAPALAGGPQGAAGIKLWDEWLSNHKDEANPTGFTMPYAAIMGGHKDLLTALIPKVEKKGTPSDTARDAELNKGDKLHDTLKAILASKEIAVPERFKQFMDTKVQAAASHLVAAIEGAVSQLPAKTVDAVDTLVKRAHQAALRLYSNVSPVCLQVRMTIGEYVDLLNELSRKSQDAGKKFSEVAGRKVRSALVGGMISIPNAKVRNTVIDATIWTLQHAEDLKKDIQSAAAKAKREAVDATGKGARTLKVAGITLSREAVQLLRPLEQTVLGGGKSLARKLLSYGFRGAAAGGELLPAIASLFFQGWALRDANKQVDATIGPQGGVEAKLPVVSATLGCMGASLEILGVLRKTFTSAVTKGEFLIKVGAGFGAVSLIVDGIQAVYSAVRAWKQGDLGAAVAYGGGALCFVVGAFVGFGTGFSPVLFSGTFLLGPLGWVLLLTAIGVVAVWQAANLERTPVEIWLDRCYWGYGKRHERKWSDDQLREEIADLNGLVLGLGVELGFNDDWSELTTGFDTLNVKLTFSNYDAKRSAYEWTVLGLDEKGASTLLMAGGEDPDVFPELRSPPSPDQIVDHSARYRNRRGTAQHGVGSYTIAESIEVNTKFFKSAKVEVKYWPDKSDPENWAEKLMTVSD